MQLDFDRLTLTLAHTWAIARTPGTDTIQTVVVRLTNPDGIVGLGEAAPVARYDESVESVERFLRKVDPRELARADVSEAMSYLDSISTNHASAKCALNLALLDGHAKRANQPLCDFLKLGFQEHRHLTSFTIGLDKPEIVRTKVAAAEAYPVLKIKVGGPADEAALRAIRDVAPRKPLRVDANEGWSTKEQALRSIERLAADSNIQFVEQPMPARTPVEDWAWLKSRSPLPIFGDESYHIARDADQAAECFHGVNVKLVKTGGISGAIEALRAARKRGLKTMLGCMIESSVLISAGAHLAELCDYLDLDGNLLITNDPYRGVTAERGVLSFAGAREANGLRVSRRARP